MADFTIRGETPLVIFDVDMDLRTADKCRVIFRQCGEVVVRADIDRLTIEEKTLSLTLSQSETLAFCAQSNATPVEIQIRARLGDMVYECPAFETTVGKLIDDEEVF